LVKWKSSKKDGGVKLWKRLLSGWRGAAKALFHHCFFFFNFIFHVIFLAVCIDSVMHRCLGSMGPNLVRLHWNQRRPRVPNVFLAESNPLSTLILPKASSCPLASASTQIQKKRDMVCPKQLWIKVGFRVGDKQRALQRESAG
jgi:hypothetical protein